MSHPTFDPAIPEMMMAAILIDESPELTLERIPVPRPRAGEALVRLRSCGVCHTDLHVMKNEVAFPRPAVVGHEISGTIVAFGPGSDIPANLRVGVDIVGAFIMPCSKCEACESGRDDLCHNFFNQNRLRGTLYDGESRLVRADGSFLAMYSMGGLAEYAVVPLTAITPIPEQLDPVDAAILGCAAMTAYGAVHRAAGLRIGDTVAVIAVGGIGSSIIQVAKACGASQIIAIDVSEDKLQLARKLGADHVVNSKDVDAVLQVRELTAGRGVDVAFEALGAPQTLEQAMKVIADGGRTVAVGIAAGAATAGIEITPLVRRGFTLTGSFGARTRVDLPAVVDLARQGGFDVSAAVTRRFTLDEANKAFQDLAKGNIQGRAVIVMGEN
jgi:Zn-dependent alcohol dehydrogenase